MIHRHPRIWPVLCKYDVTQKAGNTYHIAAPPEEDRTTAIGNIHKKLLKIGRVVPEMCSRTDKHTDRHTDTDKDTIITILPRPTWDEVTRRTCVRYFARFQLSTAAPTHSFTLGLNPSFSANPPYRSLSCVSFKIHYMDFPDCLLLLLSISIFLLFSFFLFLHFFSCRFPCGRLS